MLKSNTFVLDCPLIASLDKKKVERALYKILEGGVSPAKVEIRLHKNTDKTFGENVKDEYLFLDEGFNPKWIKDVDKLIIILNKNSFIIYNYLIKKIINEFKSKIFFSNDGELEIYKNILSFYQKRKSIPHFDKNINVCFVQYPYTFLSREKLRYVVGKANYADYDINNAFFDEEFFYFTYREKTYFLEKKKVNLI